MQPWDHLSWGTVDSLPSILTWAWVLVGPPTPLYGLGLLPGGGVQCTRWPHPARLLLWIQSSCDPIESWESALEPEGSHLDKTAGRAYSHFWADSYPVLLLLSVSLKLSVFIYKSLCDLGPHNIQYHLSCSTSHCQLRQTTCKFWHLQWASWSVRKLTNLSIFSLLLSHTLHAYKNPRCVIFLACYTPLVTNPEVTELDLVTGWRLLWQPADAAAPHRGHFQQVCAMLALWVGATWAFVHETYPGT